MSEFQYYEWQTIDRPLDAAERAAVNRLSSHIHVTSTRAQVDYSWGNFKHDPLDVLSRYFDAFLYMANWGSKQLAFRFPADLLDTRSIQPYIVEPYIALQTMGEHQILSLDLAEEAGSAWIEAEEWLSALAPLRNDIMRGDYRLLYLAWLRAVELDYADTIADDEPEPPVPGGLQPLTAALQAFVDWCELDQHLYDAAARASAAVQPEVETDWATAIRELPRAQCENFLLRLVQDEPHLSLTLRRHLQQGPQPVDAEPATSRRRVEDLVEMQQAHVEAERQRQAEAAQRRHQQEMEELAARQEAKWQEMEELLENSYAKRDYETVADQLVKLRQLADYEDDLSAFQQRLDTLIEKYGRRSTLMVKLQNKELI